MKIKSIKATLHRFEVKVPLLRKPLHRQAVICEVEASNGITGFGMTGGHFLPQAVRDVRVSRVRPRPALGGCQTAAEERPPTAQDGRGRAQRRLAGGRAAREGRARYDRPRCRAHDGRELHGWRVEFHLDMQAVGEQMFINPPGPEDNMIRIPKAPGLGLKPNRALLKDSLVKA